MIGPPLLKRSPAGKSVAITLRTRIYTRLRGTDGFEVNVNGATISITDPSGATIVAVASLTLKGTGEYIYLWDTTGLRAGTYKVFADFTENVQGNEGRAYGIVELYT